MTKSNEENKKRTRERCPSGRRSDCRGMMNQGAGAVAVAKMKGGVDEAVTNRTGVLIALRRQDPCRLRRRIQKTAFVIGTPKICERGRNPARLLRQEGGKIRGKGEVGANRLCLARAPRTIRAVEDA